MKFKTTCGLAMLAMLGAAACSNADDAADAARLAQPGKPTPTTQPVPVDRLAKAAVADFAGGCFWGSEGTFRQVSGVLATEVGYEGGTMANPTYSDVCTEQTNYAETVRVFYDPAKVTYQQLVDTFFENHDPTTADRQGPDAGTSVPQRDLLPLARAAENRPGRPGQAAGQRAVRQPDRDPGRAGQAGFYRAEEYHQDYFAKNRRALRLPPGQRQEGLSSRVAGGHARRVYPQSERIWQPKPKRRTMAENRRLPARHRRRRGRQRLRRDPLEGKDRGRVAAAAHARAVPRRPPGRHRAGLFSGKYWDDAHGGHLCLRLLRHRSVPVRNQVRQRHRLAQLLRPGVSKQAVAEHRDS